MARLVRYAGTVFVLSLAAKVLGSIRNLLFVNIAGVGESSDVFYATVGIIDSVIVFSGLNAMKSVSTTTYTQEIAAKREPGPYFTSLIYVLLGYGLLLSLPFLTIPQLMTRVFLPGFDAHTVERSAQCLRILALLVLFRGLLPIVGSLLGVQRKFVSQNVFIPLINAAAIAVVLLSPPQFIVINLCLAFTLCYGLCTLVGWCIVMRGTARLARVSAAIVKQHARRFAGLSAPLLLMNTVYAVSGTTDRIIASFFERGVITALGIAFALCFNTIGLLLDPIAKVLFPHFSKLYFDNKHEQLREAFNGGQYAVMLMFVPVSMYLVFFSTELISAVFLAKKITAGDIEITARILSVYGMALVFNALFFLPSYLLQSGQKNSFVGKVGVAVFSGNVVCSIVFSLLWGYIGIPLGTLVSLALYFILLLRGTRVYFGIRVDARFLVAAGGALCISMISVGAGKLIPVSPPWADPLPEFAVPIAGFLSRSLAYFACAVGLTALFFGRNLRMFFRRTSKNY